MPSPFVEHAKFKAELSVQREQRHSPVILFLARSFPAVF